MNSKIIYSVLVAFFIVILEGPILIPVLHRLKFGQNIREEGPKSHQKKAGTPTMGGVMFIFSTVVTMALIVKKPTDESMIALYAFIAFGAIGFIDDFLKILHKNNLGLRAYQKMILLIIVSTAFAYYGMINPDIGTSIIIPFMHKSINLGIAYVPFIILYFAATTNAVNLTDGLDGLASSVTLLVMTFFTLVSLGTGHYTLSIFCAIVVGSLLGFLRYNSFPAQIFMGDTGSLALGGAVAIVAMILKLPLLIILVGGIYVAEAVSVILQVASFKITGKRIFKMSPLHHHFELSGWHETKIASVFCIITVILCLIAFLSF
ncbi:phospho-N-acetylmuramoyl-pentapeptide-transferase [Clostridium acetireducens]|nr:phospho-N-acetylmuramoyl-pentapeptide-transferase [Clostridium acetireducens]